MRRKRPYVKARIVSCLQCLAQALSSYRPPDGLNVRLRCFLDSLEDVLGRMHLMRPVDLVEFVAFWHTVDEWLVEHPLVRLSRSRNRHLQGKGSLIFCAC